jgi:predicted O-methyltransferase YrrM
MGLVEIDLLMSEDALPMNVARLLSDARHYVAQLEDETRASIPAFVPSDFGLVYRALSAINASSLAAGRRFIEWGSGVGVVTCLAALVGFDAVGIEIEPRLVEMAEELARKQGIAAEFAVGSFVPHGAQPRVDWSCDVAWLALGGADGYAALELDPDDFDLVFAYPWPGEEQVIFDLYSDTAAVGALLLTYHGLEGLRLQRKVRR